MSIYLFGATLLLGGAVVVGIVAFLDQLVLVRRLRFDLDTARGELAANQRDLAALNKRATENATALVLANRAVELLLQRLPTDAKTGEDIPVKTAAADALVEAVGILKKRLSRPLADSVEASVEQIAVDRLGSDLLYAVTAPSTHTTIFSAAVENK
jgi:hypothetical protein